MVKSFIIFMHFLWLQGTIIWGVCLMIKNKDLNPAENMCGGKNSKEHKSKLSYLVRKIPKTHLHWYEESLAEGCEDVQSLALQVGISVCSSSRNKRLEAFGNCTSREVWVIQGTRIASAICHGNRSSIWLFVLK